MRLGRPTGADGGERFDPGAADLDGTSGGRPESYRFAVGSKTAVSSRAGDRRVVDLTRADRSPVPTNT